FAPIWTPDDEKDCCVFCDAVFSVFNRRHHCRYCGSLVCNSCSKHRRMIKNISTKKKQRVCDECVKKIDSSTAATDSATASTVAATGAVGTSTEIEDSKSEVFDVKLGNALS